MKKKIFFTSLLSLLMALNFISCAKKSSNGSPETGPTLTEELQQALDRGLALHNGKGAAAAVIIPGRETWLGAAGVSHNTTSITPNMLFGIGSVTKTFTAALVLKLAEEGALSLEDSLDRWLPNFPNIDSTITIRQLLNHTSGVFGFFNNGEIWDEIERDRSRLWTPEEVLSYVLAPYFAPGTDWHYVNTNYILLGMIIRSVTQSQVSGEFRNRLWNPLGLNNTYLSIEETLPANIIHSWSDFNGDGVIEDVTSIPRTAHDSIAWTAGGIFSTVEDLVKWSNSLFRGDILSQAFLDQMLEFVPTPANFGAQGYGLGIIEFFPDFTGGEESIGHTGAGIGHITIMVYLPDYGVSIVVMVNDDNGDSLYEIKNGLIRVILNHLQ